MATQSELEELYKYFLQRYTWNVEAFVREVLEFPSEREKKEKLEIYPWQVDVMKQYDRRSRRISIRSGHGVGKTTLVAWLMLHHALCRFPQRTAVTAPTEKQLFNALWADFNVWYKRLPEWLQQLITVKHDRAENTVRPAESYTTLATARVEQPEALQGIHSDWVLLVADEASGIPEKVFEAAIGSMSGHNAMTILVGNPVRGSGFFYDTHTKLSDLWWTKRVSCLDVPGVTEDFVTQVERTYGRESNAFRVRVLGEFPVSDDDTIIPFALVEAALDRDITVPKLAPVVWGLDPARFGSDRSALAKRQTRQLLEPVKWWAKLDTMELAGRIKLEWDTTPQHLRPQEICVDSIGMGAGVVDRLRELGLPVRGVNVSESPAAVNADKYVNLRAELWFKCLEWFNSRDCVLPEYYRRAPDGHDLVEELTKPKYKFRPGSGKILVESKDDMKKRGMRSPDLADAFVLTFATDAMTLVHGRQGSSSWKKKIGRALKEL